MSCVKITGNSRTIKFEVEKPDEIPKLRRFGGKLGPYCVSYTDSLDERTRTVQGIEMSTQKLLEIVETAQPLTL